MTCVSTKMCYSSVLDQTQLKGSIKRNIDLAASKL